MDRRRSTGFALRLLILACVVGLAGWNVSRFVGTKQVPRTKDLTFLPPPTMAKALSLGQGTAVAKLRWIDSFAYFEYQIDRQDDRVAGADGRGGFTRLYETLLALDPYFIPFYDHAVLNTGGILKDHQAALAFSLLGTLQMPHVSAVWRSAAAELAISYGWSKRNPACLDAFLGAWAEQERDAAGKQAVLDWRRGLALLSRAGLETLPWWLDQLRTAKPGTPLHRFVEDTVRDLLVAHAVEIIPDLVGGEGLRPDAFRIAARFPRGIPSWEPVALGGDGPVLRCDPFGWPFRRGADGKVVSPGAEHRRYLVMTQRWRHAVAEQAAQHGRPPRDVDEAAAWGGGAPPPPPDGGRWSFAGEAPIVLWPEPPEKPWSL